MEKNESTRRHVFEINPKLDDLYVLYDVFKNINT